MDTLCAFVGTAVCLPLPFTSSICPENSERLETSWEEMKTMSAEQILNVLLHGNQLKRTQRTGWVQRGIADAENVAAHSFGVVFATLVLAQVISEPIDLGRALAMAALHDLPEGLTTDIPTPAWRFLPAGVKQDVERRAMNEILNGNSSAQALMGLWEALHEEETAESRLVHDADRLDMYLQAIVYEAQTGNQFLQEFWEKRATFYYPEATAVYELLLQRRQNTLA
ncbi:MAG: HD family hydrolase [Chloroflexi bacterium]|nr:MAG: HD family hydrolase [Chloroflexota bacterium]